MIQSYQLGFGLLFSEKMKWVGESLNRKKTGESSSVAGQAKDVARQDKEKHVIPDNNTSK